MQPGPMTFSAPFPPGYRASGLLLHITSLPSRYGVGDLGPSAFAWIDRLAAAAQRWWQVLPLGPTGPDHSPYQALSSFAGNPLVFSPDKLIEDGLLSRADCGDAGFPADRVDFEQVVPFKKRLLARAWQTFRRGARPDLRDEFDEFRRREAGVQMDPALFMALRAKFGGAPFWQWPKELARRQPSAIAKARVELADAIDEFYFGQFTLFRQWTALRQYAGQRNIRLLGDLPIFVAADSADTWANPELFLLDGDLQPAVVAGVPPDYFSALGQRWGNPVYNWAVHKQTGYRWWIARLQVRLDILDAIRIDHFRGFEAAWHIPATAPTAVSGQWVPGPGEEFFDCVRQALSCLPLLAEDLGLITPAVTALRDRFQLPGMRVLQFAFDGDPNNPHVPHRFVPNCVAYTGTHDNDTTRGWYYTLPEHERRNFWNYAQRPPGTPDEAVREMIRLAQTSTAALAIVPFQDVLGLGSSARMNMPGVAGGQWRWRFTDDAFDDPAWQRLLEITQTSGRAA